MVDTSLHLRHTLGLPAKEFTRASYSDAQMQEEQAILSPGKQTDVLWLHIWFHLGKERKDKGEKKAAFNTTTGIKDKKEGKQKLQGGKEEVG